MTHSPAAGSAARNQYGTFQVHYASDKQQAFIRNLMGQRIPPNPIPAQYAELVEAVRANKLNKKAASRLIDWLQTLPHAAKTDGTPRQVRKAAKPVSDKQIDLIAKLVTEKVWRDPGMTVETFNKGDNTGIWAILMVEAGRHEEVESWEASQGIDHLFACPKLPAGKGFAPDVELEAGMYRTDGVIYKVYRAVHGSGRMCAKELVVDGEGSAHFEYRGLATRFTKAADRMTLEQAKEFGAIYGVCCQCGATLTDERSIEAGIGPVCAGKI